MVETEERSFTLTNVADQNFLGAESCISTGKSFLKTCLIHVRKTSDIKDWRHAFENNHFKHFGNSR